MAVSRAGGFGVLGANTFSPEQLAVELEWIDGHIGGKPYGVDILVPEHLATHGEKELSRAMLENRIPAEYRSFVKTILAEHGLFEPPVGVREGGVPGHELGEKLMDVAFRHPIRLIANALGIAPRSMIERAKVRAVNVAALVGAREHAIRQAKAGVDLIVAQGSEAGGHCGEVSTLVLVPEVLLALKDAGFATPVLAAGGIVTGRQMAACVALGAAGVWTGSVWLGTKESEVSSVFREKIIAATSRDTVRSSSRTGKPCRQLRSAWTDAWQASGSPAPLPMPLQSQISEPALAYASREAERGHVGARELVTYFIGQGVGLMQHTTSAAEVINQFRSDYAEAMQTLIDTAGYLE